MLHISYKEYGTTIVMTLAGEFFIENVEYAEEVWSLIAAKNPTVIGVNCRDIKFIDSSAIGVLVKFLNYSMKHGIELVFFDLNEMILSVFQTAKLVNFFSILSVEEFRKKHLS
ncbi:MAG: STAS domain-containing protein [Spirochaetes bacterium]|nr:STAS domain-containing protein [Spirochaetota bacterium]